MSTRQTDFNPAEDDALRALAKFLAACAVEDFCANSQISQTIRLKKNRRLRMHLNVANERERRLAEAAARYVTSVTLVEFCKRHGIAWGKFNRRARYWYWAFGNAFVAADERAFVPVGEVEAALAARVAHLGLTNE